MTGLIRRLKQVAIVLNTSTTNIVDYLKTQGYEVEDKPTTQINPTQFDFLKEKFLNISQQRDINKPGSKSEFDYKSQNKHSDYRKRRVAPHSEQLNVWEAYIDANEAIIEEKSKPIEVTRIIETRQEKNRWNEPVLTTTVAVDQKNISKELISALEYRRVIPNQHYAKYSDSFVYLSNLSHRNLREAQQVLKEFNTRYTKFTEYNSRPAIWGKISSLKQDYSDLATLIGLSSKLEEDETVYCTVEEIRNIDKYIRKYPYVRREPEVGAVSTIYNYNDSAILERRLRERLDVESITFNVRKQFDADNADNIKRVSVTVENFQGNFDSLEATLDDFGLFRESWTGYYQYKDHAGNLIEFKKDTTQCYESLWLFQKVLAAKHPTIKLIKLTGTFKPINKYDFFKENKQECLRFLREEGFNVGQKKENATLSFDVLNKHELKENIDKLEKLNLVRHNLDSLGEDFKYKVRLSVENPDLTAIGLRLKQEYKEDIDFEFSQNQLTLYFRYYSSSNEFVSFFNRLEALEVDNAIKVEHHTSEFPYAFYFKVDKETQKAIFSEQIEALAGSDFYWLQEPENADGNARRGKKVYLGKLDGRRSKYEQLVFNLTLDTEENVRFCDVIRGLYMDGEVLYTVHPDLSGDRSKNNYLKDAIEKITKPRDEFGKKPANAKLGDFIFDSSQAKGIRHSELQDEIAIVKKRLNSNKINNSQIESVAKALRAEDLALLQGPPGTGKTTVISEIIWQSILKKQDSRLLLTSESNLAVDNALGRLDNPKTMIVKPLRFGRNVQEEEGKQFQLERIEQWVRVDHRDVFEDKDGGNINNNAVQTWLNTIIRRSADSPKEYQQVLNKWREGLSNPSSSTKQEFKHAYIAHVNVVGNTCSSAGSPDFIINYQTLYNPQIEEKDLRSYAYSVKNGAPLRTDVAAKLKPVRFDAVIMDEASKATPPELLLPLTFGEKSIIIGDHRQLPPSLNEQDFKETLDTIGKFDLARHWTEKDYQTSQFERLFMNDKVSPTLKGAFNQQYRMHPQINEVIKQFYLDDGGLSCGLPLDQVDNPNLSNPFSRHHGLSHDGFISPESHTIWVNVDEPELKDGTSRVNESEVEAIRRVLKYLKNSEGFEEYMSHWEKEEDQEIGIISFYGKQMNRLNSLKREFPDLKLLMKTVDRFQGMERNIIIVSTVRSNKIIDTPHQKPSLIKYPNNDGYKKNDSLGFAETPQRLNVALSRAKRLLIVVGNASHFSRNEMYANIVSTIRGAASTQPTFIDYKLLNLYN